MFRRKAANEWGQSFTKRFFKVEYYWEHCQANSVARW